MDFNGLYGQDAHEYLRQAQGFYLRLYKGQIPLPEPGDRAFGAGYPLLGGVLSYFFPNSIFALQVLTWAAAAGALYWFTGCNKALSPGVHHRSAVLLGVLLVSAPVFWRSALTSMSDMTAFCLLMGAFRFGFTIDDRRDWRTPVLTAVLAGAAIVVRPATVPLLLPLAVWAGWVLWKQKRSGALLASVLALAGVLWVHFWAKAPLGDMNLQASIVHEWSAKHWFMRHFETENGTMNFNLPNLLFAISPLCHIGFMVFLPLFFLLVKVTDFHLPEKKVLLWSMGLYVLVIAGLPVQSIRYLLPIWGIVLLLLFPAFDRTVSYGLYFVPRILVGLLASMLLVQGILLVPSLRSLWMRNRLEQQLADQIREKVPPGGRIYTMDMDVALRSYLGDRIWENIWIKRYPSFVPGSYFLYNDAQLRQQWAGKNPELNRAAIQPLLLEPDTLAGGWVLWAVRGVSTESRK